jgi:hypothetical protein
VAINSFSQTSASQTDFMAAPGAGVLLKVSDSAALFLQARVDMDFTGSNGFGGTADSPTIFIPIQAGIGFFIN